MSYDPREMNETLATLSEMLRPVIGDGGAKRAAGTKPPWWKDDGHMPALQRHLDRYLQGELVDKDSKAHPLVHVACRALMQAGKEMREDREAY